MRASVSTRERQLERALEMCWDVKEWRKGETQKGIYIYIYRERESQRKQKKREKGKREKGREKKKKRAKGRYKKEERHYEQHLRKKTAER